MTTTTSTGPSEPMIIDQEEFKQKLERINAVYFSTPANRVSFKKGDPIVMQGQLNKRLYLILSGHVVSYRHTVRENNETASASHSIFKVFQASAGDYIGVQSFFSQWYRSSSDIIAEDDVQLAYIDDSTQPVEPEIYGPLLQQFVPAIVHELSARNMRMWDRSAEKEEAIRMLHRSEMAATLGQLSAGIAHELNNAIGVLTRKTDFVATFIDDFIASRDPEFHQLYRLGLEDDTVISSDTLRTLTRQYERLYDLNQNAARILAQLAETKDQITALGSTFINHLNTTAPYWELGHDLRDMKLAAKHATGIVRSVKLLGGGNTHREQNVNIVDSISEAVALIKSNLRGLKFDASLPDKDNIPGIYADMTELVQVWVNIIKNACDAMKIAGTENPSVSITCSLIPADTTRDTPVQEHFLVRITDNGPGVPAALHEKIFRPNFTTKKKGLSFGLGLGLAIVRRIIDSYGGNISLDSVPGHTTFTINIPTSYIYGKN